MKKRDRSGQPSPPPIHPSGPCIATDHTHVTRTTWSRQSRADRKQKLTITRRSLKPPFMNLSDGRFFFYIFAARVQVRKAAKTTLTKNLGRNIQRVEREMDETAREKFRTTGEGKEGGAGRKWWLIHHVFSLTLSRIYTPSFSLIFGRTLVTS